MFTLSPTDVEADARRAAGWLRARGARPGDRVAVVSENCPAFVAMTLGALRTGIVPVLVNVHLSEADRDWILADCDPAVVWSGEGFEHATPADLAPLPLARPMHYTSGTTGRPKGVWSGVWDTQTARAYADDESELWGDQERVVVCSPLYHSAPHRITTSTLMRGGDVVVFQHFDTDAVRAALREATGAFLVPTHLRRLGVVDMPNARKVLVAGEVCPPSLMHNAPRLWQFYGSTEGQFTVISPDEWQTRPTSVGRARAGRSLRITDGLVWVSAPSFARWEYWRSPQRTAQAWDGDFFTVRDVGHLDDGGYLYLDGRREDLIISGGVNVYPAEVERVLLEHPDVEEAAVFGVDDAEFGQRVCAAVVSRGVSADALAAWARERLPASHRPKDVRLVEALPRTPSGKVKRTDLAAGHDA